MLLRLERDAARNFVFAWARPCSDSRLDKGQLADPRPHLGTRCGKRCGEDIPTDGGYAFLVQRTYALDTQQLLL